MKQFFTILIALQCLSPAVFVVAQEHDEHAHEEGMVETGPHGGRLLESGDFSIELLIYETGVEPQYRAWAFDGDQELRAQEWDLSVTLERLDGERDVFEFSAVSDGNYRLGSGIVGEPHSFDVSVNATYRNQPYSFEFESHEGRLHMAPAIAERMGVGVAQAGSEILHETISLYGNVVPDPNQVSHIHARYTGIIQQIELNLGDYVERGQLIAVIQANNSLQNYEVRAPISGIVVDIHANPGELADAESLLTIANYEMVWAELNLFPGQIQRIRAGQSVSIRAGQLETTSSIGYLNPGDGRSPYVVARAPIENSEQMWTPGLLVEGEVSVAEYSVDLAIDNRAIQQFRDWDVVFIRIGDTYEIRPLDLGRSDGRFTEVLAGLNPGDTYVVENSFLMKADLEKSGAEHSH